MLGLGMSMGNAALMASATLRAFPAGIPGTVAAYDPSGLATMFQDEAATVPASLGDYVRHAKDKSDSSYPAIASSASQRPRLIEGDPGELWLDYDGLDDRLALPTAAASVFSGTNQWFVALAVDLDWTRMSSGAPRAFVSVATVGGQRNSADISFLTAQQKVLAERFVGGVNTFALSAVVPSGKLIVTAGWNGTQLMVGANGVETFTADTRAMINLAAEPSVSTYFATSGFASGVGDALIFNRFLSADERASLVTAMSRRINL